MIFEGALLRDKRDPRRTVLVRSICGGSATVCLLKHKRRVIISLSKLQKNYILDQEQAEAMREAEMGEDQRIPPRPAYGYVADVEEDENEHNWKSFK